MQLSTSGKYLTLLLATSLFGVTAQAGAVLIEIDGRPEGQGVTRRWQGMCSVITAAHIIPEDYRDIRIVGPQRQTVEAHLRRVYHGIDLAVLGLEPDAEGVCRNSLEFTSRSRKIGRLIRPGGGILLSRDETGTERRLPVDIEALAEGDLAIRPSRAKGIEAGMSGSPLIVNNRVIGILTLVEEGEGLVIPSDRVVQVARAEFRYRFWKDRWVWIGAGSSVAAAVLAWSKDEQLSDRVDELESLPTTNQSEILKYNSVLSDAESAEDDRDLWRTLAIAAGGATTGYAVYRETTDRRFWRGESKTETTKTNAGLSQTWGIIVGPGQVTWRWNF